MAPRNLGRPTVAIAILGDNLDHPSHREMNALIPRLADEFDVDARWVHTSSPSSTSPTSTRYG